MGVANSSRNLLTFYIFPESGIPIKYATTQRVTEPKNQMDSNRECIDDFTRKIAHKFKKRRLATLENRA